MRRQLIKDSEWQRIRPHFGRLYLEESRRLEDVAAILASDFSFQAT
jgi:uncharacterized protein (DUF2384 family)